MGINQHDDDGITRTEGILINLICGVGVLIGKLMSNSGCVEALCVLFHNTTITRYLTLVVNVNNTNHLRLQFYL